MAIIITDEDLKKDKITLNYTGAKKTRAGDDGEWFESGSVVDFHTILQTNKGVNYDLGILKGEVGDTGILIAEAYLDQDENLFIVDSQSNAINVGSAAGLQGDAGQEGLYPTAVSVDGNNNLILTMSDASTINIGALNTRIMKIADVIVTYAEITDPNYLKISEQDQNLTKTDYPELHFHITNDGPDELFTVLQANIHDFNIYIKAL